MAHIGGKLNGHLHVSMYLSYGQVELYVYNIFTYLYT